MFVRRFRDGSDGDVRPAELVNAPSVNEQHAWPAAREELRKRTIISDS